MAKTELTKTIESELYKYFYSKSMRCGLEVNCPKYDEKTGNYWWTGICDFVAYNKSEFYFIEIKISLSDFKSKNGHNLVGHRNYYCVPESLIEKVKPLIPKHVGLYSWDGNQLKNVKRCKRVEPLFMKAIGYQGISQTDWMKDNLVKSCNNIIARMFWEQEKKENVFDRKKFRLGR